MKSTSILTLDDGIFPISFAFVLIEFFIFNFLKSGSNIFHEFFKKLENLHFCHIQFNLKSSQLFRFEWRKINPQKHISLFLVFFLQGMSNENNRNEKFSSFYVISSQFRDILRLLCLAFHDVVVATKFIYLNMDLSKYFLVSKVRQKQQENPFKSTQKIPNSFGFVF